MSRGDGKSASSGEQLPADELPIPEGGIEIDDEQVELDYNRVPTLDD